MGASPPLGWRDSTSAVNQSALGAMSASTTNADPTSASSGDTPPPKRRRRFTQFGLRLLLSGMILCACVFAVFAAWVQPYYLQQLAVDSLSDTEARLVAREAEGPALKRWLVGEDRFVECHSLTVPAEMPAIKFDQFARLVFLSELELDHTLVSDRQLAAVRHMPLLKALSVDHTTIGDDGLAACGGLPQLKMISLRYTRVTDAGLARLESLTALETIYLASIHVLA